MLATLDTIKARLGLAPTYSKDDTFFALALAAASGRFDAYCNRTFERDVDATYEFSADRCEINVPLYPIELDSDGRYRITGFELKTDEEAGWVEQTVGCLVRRGCVISLKSPLGTVDQMARVTYTGGYLVSGTTAEEGAVTTALPSVIESACVEQVAYWHQRKSQLGLVSISGEGGSIQQFAQLDLLPTVKATLNSGFKRLNP